MYYVDATPLPLLPEGSVFGERGSAALPAVCAALGAERPLVVTDRGLADSPLAAGIVSALREAGAGVSVFADVDGNPRREQVDRGVAAFARGGHDTVIALGGGSGLDAGKAVAFAATQRRDWTDFALDRHGVDGPPGCETPVPWIAVPTTAGTGSEVSPSAVVSDADGCKRSIMHPAMRAHRVVCDPELTVGLPPELTAWTGVDALTHCLEAFCAPGDDPEADAWALAGMALVHRSLERAWRRGDDRAARSDMMAAAVLGGRAFRKGLGGLHGLSHALAARFGGQHGCINGVLLPHVLAANRPVVDAGLERIAAALRLDDRSADAVQARIAALCRNLEIPSTLAAIGIEWETDEAADLARAAATEPNAATNPRRADSAWATGVLDSARR